MVSVKLEFWKLLVFLIAAVFILAAISVFIGLKNIGYDEVEQVVLRK